VKKTHTREAPNKLMNLISALQDCLDHDITSHCLTDWCYPYANSKIKEPEKKKCKGLEVELGRNWHRDDWMNLLLKWIKDKKHKEFEVYFIRAFRSSSKDESKDSLKHHYLFNELNKEEVMTLATLAIEANSLQCFSVLMSQYAFLKTRPYCTTLFFLVIKENLYHLIRMCWAYWKFDLNAQDLSEAMYIAVRYNHSLCIQECQIIGG
jgi:hypothetical protein